MSELQLTQNPDVIKKFDSYPAAVKIKLDTLRALIMETAEEAGITKLEETLKWNEPSYLNKHGSTLRMDWKEKAPNQYAMYFKCTSKLVLTFKEVFGDLFQYEKNRAIVFGMNDELPIAELKKCIKATLLYHKVKNSDDLGMR